jgi:hypothetical protein
MTMMTLEIDREKWGGGLDEMDHRNSRTWNKND